MKEKLANMSVKCPKKILPIRVLPSERKNDYLLMLIKIAMSQRKVMNRKDSPEI